VDTASPTGSFAPVKDEMVLNKGAKDANEQHFVTVHLLNDLKGRAISNSLVTGLSQFIQFALNLGAIMVLARLLAPEDFGLVAMVTTTMGFLRVFSDAGLSTATVQREGISHAQVSNLFWVNLSLGGAGTAAIACAAPLIAWFYREPRLVYVTVALSVSFLLTAATVQHLALLKRQMRFGILAMIQLTSLGLGVGVGITMGFMRFGYWSLVGMFLCSPLFSFIITWAASRWRPKLPTRHSGTRPLLRFGANLSASSLLWSLARGTDGLLIGRFCGSAGLGLYSRAYALMIRPVEQLMSPIESVFLPTLARVQSQPDRYRRIFLRAYGLVALTSLSFTGVLLPLSKPIILTVLGQKWEAAAAIFASFVLLALYSPICSTASWLLTSQGRGRDFLMSSSICSLVTVTSFLIGLPFGPTGVAFSFSVTSLLVNLPVVFYIAGRQGPVTTNALWRSFFQHLPLWFVVCAATASARHALNGCSSLMQLLICVPVGLLTGALFTFVYAPARRTAQSAFQVFKEWKGARRL
jgi:O-antigen/teichoic acid export membrane protein